MEFLQITLTGWTALIITLSMSVLAAVMFILGTKRVHYTWGLFSLATAMWTAGFYAVTLAESASEAQFWWKITFIGIILVPFTFFHFVLEFIENKWFLKNRTFALILIYGVALQFLVVNFTSNSLVDQVTFLFNEIYYDKPAAPLHPFFTFFYTSLIVFGYYLTFREYLKRKSDILFRSQVKYFFLGTGIGFLGGSMDFILVYGIEIHPIRNLTVILGSFIVGFAMLRYKLFDVRVVTAQLLTLILLAFSFVRLVFSTSIEETIFNIIILSFTFVVGVYLILSVKKEVEQREQIEKLAKDLRVANERLKELDKLKSQFLSIASHDLRAPLTAIRNFMSIMLDGTYGKLPAAANEGMRQVFERATEMAKSVDSYLNVSRIEQGRMKYDFVDADLLKILSDTVSIFKPNVEQKGLELKLNVPQGETFPIKADIGKLQEVLNNLVDNSIKYTPKGSITVSLEKKGTQARLVIQDTGVGMTENTMRNLFKLFSPGEDSKKINPSSTGVGLYITKAHVEAHKGTIRAESNGEGKGSRFVVELPLK